MAKKEKTGESEPISNHTNRLSYRFWDVSHGLLFILWVQTAALLICTFTMADWLGTGYQVLFGLSSVLSTAWAIWASLPLRSSRRRGPIDRDQDASGHLSYRFWEISHDFLFILWVQTAALLICTFTLTAWLGIGHQLLCGLLAVLSTAWAIWASLPPKT